MRERGVDVCGAIVAPYTCAANKRLFTERGIGYVDAPWQCPSGLRQACLLPRESRADRGPWPTSSELRSLKGKATEAAVRTLLDFDPPYGIRQLADRAGVSAPTPSRVVNVLDKEGLVDRKPRGPVQSLDWEGTLRRWRLDYSVTETNGVATGRAVDKDAEAMTRWVDGKPLPKTDLVARRPESPVTSRCLVECVHLDPLHIRNGNDCQLGDAVIPGESHRLRPVVYQQNADLTPITGVDQPGTVDHTYPATFGMSASGKHESRVPVGDGNCDSGGNRSPLPWFQNQFGSAVKIHCRIADMGGSGY